LKTIDHSSFVSYGLLASSLLLMTIWPMSGTIALRHVAIGFSVVFSILYLIQIDFIHIVKQTSWFNLAPIFFIATFFLWVIAHYLFLSSNSVMELRQLESLWLRVIFILVSGLTLGLLIFRNPSYYVWIYAGLLVPALIVFLQHLLVWSSNAPLTHQFLPAFIYADSKLMPGFFVAIACAFVIPLHFSTKTFKPNFRTAINALIILSGGLIGVLTQSKNTLIIWGGLLMILAFIELKSRPKSDRVIFVLTIIIFLVCAFLTQDKFRQSWIQIPEDIRIAVQVDKYPHWQNRDTFGYPKLDNGTPVITNTYERVAWATKGLDLIQKYPLGYGIHNGSFKYLLQKDGIESPSIAFTHSGWIDFTLGEGIPGTLCVWLAIACVIWSSRRNNTLNKSVTLWVIPTIFVYWIIGELSNKHYVEFLFFMISFFIGINLLNGQEHLLKENQYASI